MYSTCTLHRLLLFLFAPLTSQVIDSSDVIIQVSGERDGREKEGEREGGREVGGRVGRRAGRQGGKEGGREGGMKGRRSRRRRGSRMKDVRTHKASL